MTKKTSNKQESAVMKDLLAKESESFHLPQVGDLIEGTIIKVSNSIIMLELGPLGTGVIYGGELKENKDFFRGLKVGQKLSTLVVDPENEDGYIELSLTEANLEQTWNTLKESKQENKTITVKVIEANRGGLIIKFSSLVGFLPVSQLSSQNYPRVEGGDKNKILNHLNSFIGQELKVKVIGLDKKTEKLVVSEKAVQEKELKENLKNYKKGDVVEGVVTALADFGAFIKFDNDLEGLAHISELDWQIIDHPSQILQENEKIKAQIIDISNGQISFSLKALKKDPWENIESKYKTGQTVKGKVTKLSPLGAFVEIDEGIHGLAHISEFSKRNQQIEQTLKIEQSYDFEILSLAPGMHKMSLGLKDKN